MNEEAITTAQKLHSLYSMLSDVQHQGIDPQSRANDLVNAVKVGLSEILDDVATPEEQREGSFRQSITIGGDNDHYNRWYAEWVNRPHSTTKLNVTIKVGDPEIVRVRNS